MNTHHFSLTESPKRKLHFQLAVAIECNCKIIYYKTAEYVGKCSSSSYVKAFISCPCGEKHTLKFHVVPSGCMHTWEESSISGYHRIIKT